jgi:hypothetical protein
MPAHQKPEPEEQHKKDEEIPVKYVQEVFHSLATYTNSPNTVALSSRSKRGDLLNHKILIVLEIATSLRSSR